VTGAAYADLARPCRYIPPPDADARRQIIEIQVHSCGGCLSPPLVTHGGCVQLARTPHEGELDAAVLRLMAASDGCSGAELVGSFRDACLLAIEESRDASMVRCCRARTCACARVMACYICVHMPYHERVCWVVAWRRAARPPARGGGIGTRVAGNYAGHAQVLRTVRNVAARGAVSSDCAVVCFRSVTHCSGYLI
jgi:hypothetical protein